jgi:hypothetical protein
MCNNMHASHARHIITIHEERTKAVGSAHFIRAGAETPQLSQTHRSGYGPVPQTCRTEQETRPES